jgi:kynurenine formamidase
MHEHNGTHVDAPAHFHSEAKPEAHVTIDQLPVTNLIGRGVHLDCRTCREGQYVSKQQIIDWESQHGELAKLDIVLFEFGWSERWKLRPNDRPYVEDWPGISMETAQYLISRSVAAVGVDTLSPDPPEALRTNPVHPVILEKRILIIENLTNLEVLPDFFLFLALPLKIRSGSGSPIRPVALF